VVSSYNPFVQAIGKGITGVGFESLLAHRWLLVAVCKSTNSKNNPRDPTSSTPPVTVFDWPNDGQCDVIIGRPGGLNDGSDIANPSGSVDSECCVPRPQAHRLRQS
jgi:hypothetical protein